MFHLLAEGIRVPCLPVALPSLAIAGTTPLPNSKVALSKDTNFSTENWLGSWFWKSSNYKFFFYKIGLRWKKVVREKVVYSFHLCESLFFLLSSSFSPSSFPLSFLRSLLPFFFGGN